MVSFEHREGVSSELTVRFVEGFDAPIFCRESRQQYLAAPQPPPPIIAPSANEGKSEIGFGRLGEPPHRRIAGANRQGFGAGDLLMALPVWAKVCFLPTGDFARLFTVA
jgi:hypothetical protein